jgi:hypothetical protein
MIALASGALGFTLGLIHVMQNLDDPSKLGAGLAVAMVSCIYGLLISEFTVSPMINRLCARASLQNTEPTANPEPAPTLTPAGPSSLTTPICTVGMLSIFFMVLYSIASIPSS